MATAPADAVGVSPELIRISQIAGRYLVFDVEHVSRLRRSHNICGILSGTTPQNPTQNVFQGLPVELFPEEAREVVNEGIAYIADEATAHSLALLASDTAAREAYIVNLKHSRQATAKILADEQAKRVAESAKKEKARRAKVAATPRPGKDEGDSLFEEANPSKSDGRSSNMASASSRQTRSLAITPTTSTELIANSVNDTEIPQDELPNPCPLYRHLHQSGYYMTPGLRFGAQYSVYPGDPLRFHAHFLANNYDWDEDIPVLDLVGSGRLGTAVKKAFLIGGEDPNSPGNEDGNGKQVRPFSIEWAAM
jgi:tRNA-splicing endonuclease subunit Sen34